MIHTESRPYNKYYFEDEYKLTKLDYFSLFIAAASMAYILYLIVTGD